MYIHVRTHQESKNVQSVCCVMYVCNLFSLCFKSAHIHVVYYTHECIHAYIHVYTMEAEMWLVHVHVAPVLIMGISQGRVRPQSAK